MTPQPARAGPEQYLYDLRFALINGFGRRSILANDRYTFDPRNNSPRWGRILIARGRDAADVAITTSFGPSTLESFKVWTDEIIAS